MSREVTDYICPACRDSFDMPTCWQGAPIGAELVRLHIDVCEAVDVMVYVLLDELEAFMRQQAKRCPHIRVVDGKTFRCKHTVGACIGDHFMVRVSHD